MFSETFGRQTLIAAPMTIALLALATSTLAQVRTPGLAQLGQIQNRVSDIRGKITDGQGEPVPGAAVEVARVSGSGAQEGQRSAGRAQIWKARTNENGDYMIRVPSSAVYLVTASKEGVGTDETKVVVEIDRVTTANLRLWKAAPAGVTEKGCAESAVIKAFEDSVVAANAGDPALARLLRWLEAAKLHTPGCSDPPAIEVGSWSPSDFETLLGDLTNLQISALVWEGIVQPTPQFLSDSAFLQRTRDGLRNGVEVTSEVEIKSRIGSLTGASVQKSRARLFPDRIQLYNRWFRRDEIEQIFHGNETLRRGAVLHADIAVFGDHTSQPTDGGLAEPNLRGSRFHLIGDGRREGGGRGTVHWHIGRLLLDTVTPSPSVDHGALLWYRAASAYLFREGHLSEVLGHLDRARQIFPDHPFSLLDSAYLHEKLSSPAIQAAVQDLRAMSGDDVAVDSRRNELQRAERFFRQALALAPDDADIRLRLGHTIGELGRPKEAAEELRNAIDAKLDRERLYLAELFLGHQEQALRRHEEAKRRYEHAAELYPSAQSPRLALSQLARQSGDRKSALRAIQSVTAHPPSDVDRTDPWWDYYHPHLDDAEDLMDQMRKFWGVEAQ